MFVLSAHPCANCPPVQRRLVPESELADSHSRFRTIEGIKVHYRVEYPPQGADAEATNIAAVHCYHGFGANTFSWSFTQVCYLLACQTTCSISVWVAYNMAEMTTHIPAMLPCLLIDCDVHAGSAGSPTLCNSHSARHAGLWPHTAVCTCNVLSAHMQHVAE